MEDTYAALIQSQLNTVGKMKDRYDRKHTVYSRSANILALTLGLFGAIAALRDQISPYVPGGSLPFMILGTLTAFGTTAISQRFEWAGRSKVALELKIKCFELIQSIPGECVGKSSNTDLEPVWKKVSAAIDEIIQISIRNNIDPEDRGGAIGKG